MTEIITEVLEQMPESFAREVAFSLFEGIKKTALRLE
jgi:hypothetical protein